jgi:predicted porin
VQNNTVFASRNSAVGLRHGLGTVLLGRWDTPFRLGGAIDAFGDLTIAGYGAAMSDRGNYKRREQNVVQYWTPAWAGFDARLHYTANEARTAARNPSVYGASVAYTAVGSVYVGYAYEKHTAVADGVDESGNELGINIRTEHWKIGGLLQEFDRTNASRQKSWLGNLVYNLGKHRLVYQHQYSKGGAGLAAPQPRCTVDSVGYQYNFSRRTYVLVLYTRTDNNDAAACNFGANNLVISAGQDPRGWAMGVRHIF